MQEVLNEKIESNAVAITSILKAMSHEVRLQFLSHQTSGGKSVAELQTTLTYRQPSVSQQFSHIRLCDYSPFSEICCQETLVTIAK